MAQGDISSVGRQRLEALRRAAAEVVSPAALNRAVAEIRGLSPSAMQTSPSDVFGLSPSPDGSWRRPEAVGYPQPPGIELATLPAVPDFRRSPSADAAGRAPSLAETSPPRPRRPTPSPRMEPRSPQMPPPPSEGATVAITSPGPPSSPPPQSSVSSGTLPAGKPPVDVLAAVEEAVAPIRERLLNQNSALWSVLRGLSEKVRKVEDTPQQTGAGVSHLQARLEVLEGEVRRLQARRPAAVGVAVQTDPPAADPQPRPPSRSPDTAEPRAVTPSLAVSPTTLSQVSPLPAITPPAAEPAPAPAPPPAPQLQSVRDVAAPPAADSPPASPGESTIQGGPSVLLRRLGETATDEERTFARREPLLDDSAGPGPPGGPVDSRSATPQASPHRTVTGSHWWSPAWQRSDAASGYGSAGSPMGSPARQIPDPRPHLRIVQHGSTVAGRRSRTAGPAPVSLVTELHQLRQVAREMESLAADQGTGSQGTFVGAAARRAKKLLRSAQRSFDDTQRSCPGQAPTVTIALIAKARAELEQAAWCLPRQ
eukprot:TRINITY_DN36943_c0_g1_i1.p1 TRINITY_DN36943_c0_g1~~TRINITY_DN36943_c0_g1_i1.p1  ORF type:complete len:554 (+),score=134.42 TRINITY_DN36943_c0_g1_i1:48-1664(+)